MNVPTKFWNIFQCVLDTLGEDTFRTAETQIDLLSAFREILELLKIASPMVTVILKFINWAWRLFRVLRAVFFNLQGSLTN